MKWVMNRSGGVTGHGWLNKWAGCAFGVVLFVSAGGAVASAQTAMTQKQYLQRMANICGTLSGSATDADLINWARGKGLSPTGGWNLGANLTKDVMAQTMVQLLKLDPGKGNRDPVGILDREGIVIGTRGGYVTADNFTRVINGSIECGKPGRGGDGEDHDGHNGGGRGDDDDDDDDDDGRPTGTKPGEGHGDKNHDHSGPPGKKGGGHND